MQNLRARIGGLLAAVALATTGVVVAAPVAAQADVLPSYFEVTDYSGRAFVIKLTDERKIQHARAVLAGTETEEVHVMGRLRKTGAEFNPGWDFYIDPDTITFFQMAIEVCDASFGYVNDHLDEAGGAFLPGLYYCPWSSRLVRELKS
jgi:hypothetical protein